MTIFITSTWKMSRPAASAAVISPMFVFIFAAVFVCISCEHGALPDATVALSEKFVGWKFEQGFEGNCFVNKYRISFANYASGPEPVMIHAAIDSYPINCVDGYSFLGMNFVPDGLAPSNFVMSVCFFIPDGQGIKCYYWNNSAQVFSEFISTWCGNKSLTIHHTKGQFYIGFNRTRYCDCSDCHLINKDGCENGMQIGDYITQYDAMKDKDVKHLSDSTERVFPFGTFVVTRNRGTTVFNFLKGSAKQTSINLPKNYDFINVESPERTKMNCPSSFIGFRYEKHGENDCCIIGYNVDDTSKFYHFKAPCYNSTKQGYNVQWDYRQKMAYLKVCFMVNDTLDDYRLVCHRFGNGSYMEGSKTEYNFDLCRAHFAEKKPINVVIGDIENQNSAFKEIRIETSMKVCILNPLGDGAMNPGHTLLDRGNSLAYDPVRNKVIKHEEDGTVEGVRIYAPRDAKLYSLGQYTIVKCCGKRWYIIKDGKYETRDNWWFDYVVQEAPFISLVMCKK